MQLRLKARILLFTTIPLAALALSTVWVVHHTVSRQVQENVRKDLSRATAVFEDMLAERSEQLRTTSLVIARDPRFFSTLSLPGSHQDPVFRNTVEGVARDFNKITHADLFEVLDAEGVHLASAGRDAVPNISSTELVGSVLTGAQSGGVVVLDQGNYLATATVVVAGGRVVGVLVLGSRIGQELAEKLRELTRSEVSFFSGQILSGSTLAEPEDRAALLEGFAATLASSGGADSEEHYLELAGRDGTYLALARPMPGSALEDGQVYILQRSLRLETAFLGSMQSSLAQMSLAALLAVLLAAIVISNRITNPLRRIVRAAEEIERGNYDHPLGETSRDEIGYLAQRFDEMRQHERAYVTSLQEVARLKTEFINVASHELRTPISVILGYQELMADDSLGSLTDEQKEALHAIGDSAKILSGIAERATQVAQIEGSRIALQLSDCDVSESLRESVRIASREASGRNVQVLLEIDHGTPFLRVDGPRLTEAVANLVRNGIRFTPDGGQVEVRSRWAHDTLEIEVRDTGIGIPPEKLDAIFDKGFVVRDSRHHHSSQRLEFRSAGLGLGLAIARGIVESHGGTIEVESEPGAGSTFRIRMRPERASSEEAKAA